MGKSVVKMTPDEFGYILEAAFVSELLSSCLYRTVVVDPNLLLPSFAAQALSANNRCKPEMVEQLAGEKLAFIMVALCNKADHYIFILFLSFFFFFISSPNLSGQRLDVYHTSHMTWS